MASLSPPDDKLRSSRKVLAQAAKTSSYEQRMASAYHESLAIRARERSRHRRAQGRVDDEPGAPPSGSALTVSERQKIIDNMEGEILAYLRVSDVGDICLHDSVVHRLSISTPIDLYVV